MEALLHLCSAFGLSSASGLNAYIPLLTVGIMANRGIIHLSSPYDALGQGWCIAILVILLAVEIIVDKVPGADHVNDVIQSFVRPTAGAILFASQAGIIHGVHPGVWITIGLLMGGSVHATKALARPVVNVATAGFGAPVVSVVEDLVGTVVSVVAILVPILAVALVGLFGWMLFKLFRRTFFGKRRPIAVPAVAVMPALQPVGATAAPAELAEARGWGGGV
jgi:hypothetical protein